MKVIPSALQFVDSTKHQYLLCYVRLLQDILLNYRYEDISDYIGSEYAFYQVERSEGLSWYRCTMDPWEVLKRDHHFTIRSYQFDHLHEALQHVQEQLDKGILSMLLVDLYYLSFSRQYYQKNHRTHYISITGISFEQKVVTILDSAGNYHNIEIGFDMLEEGWFSPGVGIRFDCTDIVPPAEPIPLTKEMFFQAIRTNIENMLRPDRTLAHEKAVAEFGDYETIAAGLDGLATLSDSVSKLMVLGKEHLLDIYHLLGTVPEQLELHANYLRNMAKRFDLAPFSLLAEDMFEIVQNWAVLRNMILKASMRDSDQFFTRCIERCHQIQAMETRFVSRCQEAVSALTL